MNIQDALQVCLADLEKGVALEKSLARFPEFAGELRPMLETAEFARGAAHFPRDGQARDRSRTLMLAHADRLRKAPKSWLSVLPRFAMAAFTAMFVALVGVGGLITVSAQALPGDTFYGMKRSVEAVRLALTSEPESKRDLTEEFKHRRINETLALMDLGRREVVTFEGTVTDITPESWTVAGIVVILESNTNINRPIEIGMGIEVTGEVQQEGWIESDSIRLRSYAVVGMVQQIHDSHWIVGGMRLEVDVLTEIEEGIEVLDQVRAEVYIENSGLLTAQTIRSTSDATLPNDQTDPTPTPLEDGDRIEFEGVVTSISDPIWIVDDMPVEVTVETVIEGPIQIGDAVRVIALRDPDGALQAIRIKSTPLSDGSDATPTQTPAPANETAPPRDEPSPEPEATDLDHGGDDPPPTALPPDTPPTDLPPSD